MLAMGKNHERFGPFPVSSGALGSSQGRGQGQGAVGQSDRQLTPDLAGGLFPQVAQESPLQPGVR